MATGYAAGDLFLLFSGGGALLLVGGVWALAGRAALHLARHEHDWLEHGIGAALTRRICRECRQLRIGRRPYHGITVPNRGQAILFEFRPDLITNYTKPRILRLLDQQAGAPAFGQRRAS